MNLAHCGVQRGFTKPHTHTKKKHLALVGSQVYRFICWLEEGLQRNVINRNQSMPEGRAASS